MEVNDAVKNMVRPWLTGNDEKDAKSLSRTFRMCKLTIAEWRKVVKQSKQTAQGKPKADPHEGRPKAIEDDQ